MHRAIRRHAALLGLLLGSAACAGPPRPAAGPPGDERVVAAADWTRAEIVDVALDEYNFRPGRLALRENRPYRLRLVNRGARAHDFTAPAFFQTAALRGGDSVAADIRAKGGSVDVPAGQTREVALVPLRSGSYPLECRKPLHDIFGMEGEITVAPP
jgi:uncharacterized cupredoxin-like copper-binding protein